MAVWILGKKNKPDTIATGSEKLYKALLATKPVKHTESSQVTKVYKALKQAGHYGLTNGDLSKICLSWHRRIGNLRADGVNIQCVRVTGGTWKYYMTEDV